MEKKNVLLSVKDLEVKFRVRGRILSAIRGVSLDIYEDESIAIVGESGAGKSVFTKAFAGMLDSNGFVSNGSIIFNDPELSDTVVKLLPQVANLMKWLRRYMIDQMNSDYVKFARSGGLTENEIFTKHILKNAAIPIVQGVPASVLGALIGAIITERVYVVPGAGNLLTEAINQYDNGVIVGVTLFYALLSVLAIILGDILMSMVDPRISFSTKDR